MPNLGKDHQMTPYNASDLARDMEIHYGLTHLETTPSPIRIGQAITTLLRRAQRTLTHEAPRSPNRI